jgi:hypothetical protein
MRHPPFADQSLIGTCTKIAHFALSPSGFDAGSRAAFPGRADIAFYDALPANVLQRAPVAPAHLAPKRAPQASALQRALAAVDNWFYRQRLRSREAYLAQAQNVFELEARMRELERVPHY